MSLAYSNYEDVNTAFHKLLELEYQKSRLEQDKSMKISSMEKVYSEELEPIAMKINEISDNILAFAKANHSDFQKTKTKKLPNGTISCRISKRLDIIDEQNTLELIKRMELSHCIRKMEGINREVVKTLDDNTLKKIKVAVITEQNFSIKTNQSEIKTVATA